jgi:hypothetical protein
MRISRGLVRFQHAVTLMAAVGTAVLLTACGTSGIGTTAPGERWTSTVVAGEPAYVVEAEDLLPSSAFTTHEDVEASSGRAVEPRATAPAGVAAQRLELPLHVREAGDYTLWVRVAAVAHDAGEVTLGLAGDVGLVRSSQSGAYAWVEVVRVRLEAGSVRLTVGHAQPGLRIDILTVVQRDGVSHDELDRLVDELNEEVGDAPGPSPAPGGRHAPSLRGDPGFDRSSLSGEVATWYARLSAELAGGSFDALKVAGQDDIYEYGRTLHTYVQAVLVAFRLTGDLALLDHVDEIAERMRAQLRDGWRGTLDGTDGTRDGYLNWVDRYTGGEYQGKDTMLVNEIKTHALVAMMAYALEVNRDLASPSGRDYGAHADFWENYLVNHFEAKWRERRDRPSGFPFATRAGMHTYTSWLKWHYYMGLLTGDEAYTREAERMADAWWSEIRTLATPAGEAYVWPSSLASAGGTGTHLQLTTYARYVYGDVIEFHFEGFHRWASSATLQSFARTFTTFIINRSDPLRDGFAGDIGGSVSRAGLLPQTSASRLTTEAYRASPYALIGAWDDTGRIDAINDRLFAGPPRAVPATQLLASQLLVAWEEEPEPNDSAQLGPTAASP